MVVLGQALNLIQKLKGLTLEKPKKVNFVITIDYEGNDFYTENLDESDIAPIESLRHDFPNIPFVHYLNATYFATNEHNLSQINRQLRRIVFINDELGLHIHPWESLVEKSGVTFKEGPSYFGDLVSQPKGTYFPQRGGDVPLWVYSSGEIQKIMEYSLLTLQKNGFSPITSFRAGGWQSDSKILNLVADYGFTSESSAIPPQIVLLKYPDSHLANYTNQLWPDMSYESQPQKYSSPKNNDILLFPNNAGLADYVDEKLFTEIVNKNLDLEDQEVSIVYGFHLETAKEYLPRVRFAIEHLQSLEQCKVIELNITSFEKLQFSLNEKVKTRRTLQFVAKPLI